MELICFECHWAWYVFCNAFTGFKKEEKEDMKMNQKGKPSKQIKKLRKRKIEEKERKKERMKEKERKKNKKSLYFYHVLAVNEGKC